MPSTTCALVMATRDEVVDEPEPHSADRREAAVDQKAALRLVLVISAALTGSVFAGIGVCVWSSSIDIEVLPPDVGWVAAVPARSDDVAPGGVPVVSLFREPHAQSSEERGDSGRDESARRAIHVGLGSE